MRTNELFGAPRGSEFSKDWIEDELERTGLGDNNMHLSAKFSQIVHMAKEPLLESVTHKIIRIILYMMQ